LKEKMKKQPFLHCGGGGAFVVHIDERNG